MKILNTIFKVIFCLLLVSPILGALGVFPKPTPDLYNTQEAFVFIDALYNTGYMTVFMALVFVSSIVLVITKRMSIAAILVLPITSNILFFHLFLDGGIFTAGAIMADILFILNIYFIWQNRELYKNFWRLSKS